MITNLKPMARQKAENIQKILENTLYTPNSGLYKSAQKALNKLSRIEVGQILTILQNKN